MNMAICFLRKEQALCVQNLRSVWGQKFLVLEKNETLYTIRLLPVGGYVRMAGDGLEEPPVEPGMNVKIKTE